MPESPNPDLRDQWQRQLDDVATLVDLALRGGTGVQIVLKVNGDGRVQAPRMSLYMPKPQF